MSAASKPAFFNNGVTNACFCDIGRRPCDREALISAVMNGNSTSITSFNRNVAPPAANDTGTALGQDGSEWSRDLATLIFDFGGHVACGWCGSSSSIRVPSLKFVGLAVRKIWRTMCVSINGPGDLDLWPFVLETGMPVASEVGNLHFKFGQARPSVSGVIRYVRDGRTNERTKPTLNAPSIRWGA